MNSARKQSAMVFILKGLIPYSRENLMLSFSPNRFFNELEKTSGYKQKTLKEAFRRGRKQGLIEIETQNARLTELGQRKVQPYIAKKFKHSGKLMIIFDIPEANSRQRNQLRTLLRNCNFKQVQKSVWESTYDHTKTV